MGVCALCHKQEIALDASGKVRLLSVDHNHATGRVRGLLCHRCNVILGAVDALGITWFIAASQYLERDGA